MSTSSTTPPVTIPYDQRMRGSKILITGPTGQLAAPVAKTLATHSEVWDWQGGFRRMAAAFHPELVG